MKYFLFLLVLFVFSGCTHYQCGIEKTAFEQLDSVSKSEICSKYQKEQFELRKKREEQRLLEEKNRERKIKIEEDKLREIYKTANIEDILRIEIVGGIFKPYGLTKKIRPFSFTLVNGEVKKICFHDFKSTKICIWVTYQNGKIIWNIIPDRRDLPFYIDKNFDRTFYKSSKETITYPNNWYKKHLINIHINGKYRGAEMDFKAYIHYSKRRDIHFF